jgi:molybdenum cofactor synthesis domain-containing protein
MSDRPVAAVVVASTRAAAGVHADTTGPLLVAALRDWGFAVDDATIVADGDAVGSAISSAAADGAELVLTTGGTGINPRDRTPEVTAPLLDYQVPGIAEALRAAGTGAGVPTAMLSRGIAGVIERARSGSVDATLVVNIAGSSGAVRDAIEVLAPVLPHALEQLRGGDHQRPSPS